MILALAEAGKSIKIATEGICNSLSGTKSINPERFFNGSGFCLSAQKRTFVLSTEKDASIRSQPTGNRTIPATKCR